MISGAHPTHIQQCGYACRVCHPAQDSTGWSFSVSYHRNGVTDVLFDTNAYPPLDSARFGNSTCSKVSCHGYQQVDTLDIKWASGDISWTSGPSDCDGCHDYSDHQYGKRMLGNIPCYGCHDPRFHSKAKDTTMNCNICHELPPATGAHVVHHECDCNVCHSGYSKEDSSIAIATHLDGKPTVNGHLSGGVYSPTTHRCSNISCHDSRKW